MTLILKYLSPFLLAFILIGCQNGNNSSKKTDQQNLQQNQAQQQQDQLGQLQQPPQTDTDVSDKEVETFADAFVDAREVQANAQEKMVDVIEDEGLDVETYQKIAQAAQRGQAKEADASDEEIEKFENASNKLREVQGEIEKKVKDAVEENGMEMKRFQEISQAAQQDPELQQEIQVKVQKKMMDNQEGM